jgi:uncharacterized membrane protein
VGHNAPVPARHALVVAGIHSPGFDLLLIGHVACALLGFGAVATSAVQATRLLRTGGREVASSFRRYFAPGVNWVGRLLYGVPVLGLALLADSSGRFGIDDGWVLAGLLLWLLAAVVAEGVVWPAERRIQEGLTGAGAETGAGSGTETGAAAPAGLARRDCLVVAVGGAGLVLLFVGATVVMVARP